MLFCVQVMMVSHGYGCVILAFSVENPLDVCDVSCFGGGVRSCDGLLLGKKCAGV